MALFVGSPLIIHHGVDYRVSKFVAKTFELWSLQGVMPMFFFVDHLRLCTKHNENPTMKDWNDLLSCTKHFAYLIERHKIKMACSARIAEVFPKIVRVEHCIEVEDNTTTSYQGAYQTLHKPQL